VPGKLRIIGGKWRSRKLDVMDADGLRPTPDRVRETLFNWLQPTIGGASCLDLYAGTGALGFEALSRGADRVVMIDSSPSVVKTLDLQARKLGAEGAKIVCADAMHWLDGAKGYFDIVFLDPPYAEKLLGKVLERLLHCGITGQGTLVYAETDRAFVFDDPRIRAARTARAGNVHFMLYEVVQGTGR